jgi:hypothetical protein
MSFRKFLPGNDNCYNSTDRFCNIYNAVKKTIHKAVKRFHGTSLLRLGLTQQARNASRKRRQRGDNSTCMPPIIRFIISTLRIHFHSSFAPLPSWRVFPRLSFLIALVLAPASTADTIAISCIFPASAKLATHKNVGVRIFIPPSGYTIKQIHFSTFLSFAYLFVKTRVS